MRTLIRTLLSLLTIVTLCFIVALYNAAHGAEVEAMAKYAHGSDPTIGRFSANVDDDDPSSDSLLGGVTITAGKRKRWEIDIAGGLRQVHCACKNNRGPAGDFAVRYYPGRK